MRFSRLGRGGFFDELVMKIATIGHQHGCDLHAPSYPWQEGPLMIAESGRPGRAELLAKRPHGRLRRLSAELENVGEASDFLERRAHGRVPAAFSKNPENVWLNLAKIQQHSGKICEHFGKNRKHLTTN